MEKAGLNNLKKDETDIWRASAMQGDNQAIVALDFRGSVVAIQ